MQKLVTTFELYYDALWSKRTDWHNELYRPDHKKIILGSGALQTFEEKKKIAQELAKQNFKQCWEMQLYYKERFGWNVLEGFYIEKQDW